MNNLNPLLNNDLLYLFAEGKYYHAYNVFGAHRIKLDNKTGFQFTVWAPDVRSVALISDFTGWENTDCCLKPVDSSGIWTVFVPDFPENAGLSAE